jgi:hypothetical protein
MLKASRVLLAVLAALGMSSVLAQTGPVVGGYNTTTSGNTTSHSYAASGASDFARLTRGGYDPATNQSGFQTLLQKKGFTPKGSEYDYRVSKPVPKAAMAKALAKTLPVVGNLLAMKELLDALYGEDKAQWNAQQGQWEATSSGGYIFNWNQFTGSTCAAVAAQLDGAYPTGSVQACASGNMNVCNTILYQGTPPVTDPVTEQSLQDKINATPGPLPLPADDLLESIPAAAKQELAQDIANDTANPPRAVPTSPAGVESPSGWTVPESITTRYTNDALNRPQTITTTTQTVVRTLPTGQLQHDTTTTTTTTTQTGTNPDGSPITETSTSTETTTTTPSPPPDGQTPPPAQEIITCGLPDTPPCKIDETGTPQADPVKTQAEVDSLFGDVKTCLQDIRACLPTLPDLSWSFALPTGCAPLYFDTLVGVVIPIDMCEHQPMIHDLMTMVWAAAGLFGAIAMVGRFSGGA